jgi:telomerase protein component 1
MTIRVFISSTFRDMHAERDYLSRVVFPELRERCRARRIQIVDVDLRWGVSQEDAENGKALDVCLDEIDACRPFFLGILGQRYGWIPPGRHHSITAEEIYHGVLHGHLPKQIVDLRPILEGPAQKEPLTEQQRESLVRCYQWDAEKRKYLRAADVSAADAAVLRPVFARLTIYQQDRSYFYFRSAELTEKLAGSDRAGFLAENPAAERALAELKQEIKNAGLPWFEYVGIESFGRLVLETLWKRIEAETEDADRGADWLTLENELHELFVADRNRRFVGRQQELQRLYRFADQDRLSGVLVVWGEAGSGKSALMARFATDTRRRHADWTILSHFVGASADSADLRRTLKRLCAQLDRSIGDTGDSPEDLKELTAYFSEALAKAAARADVVLILDAVNQMAGDSAVMNWLPAVLPTGVRVVVSTIDRSASEALVSLREGSQELAIPPLGESEIQQLVQAYLAEIRHEFPNRQVESLFFEKVRAGNPLYILVALEELRLYGEFESLERRIGVLPATVAGLFSQVLERIEADLGSALVRDCMCYVACGRGGAAADELQALLKEHAAAPAGGEAAEKYPDLLWARLYRAFDAHLLQRGGLIDFFHQQLKEAVLARYLQPGDVRRKKHAAMAGYFRSKGDPRQNGTWKAESGRALSEVVHHQVAAELWEDVLNTLCSLEFVSAKCAAGFTYGLAADYEEADQALPATRPAAGAAMRDGELLESYSRGLTACAVGQAAGTMPEPPVCAGGAFEPPVSEDVPDAIEALLAFQTFVTRSTAALVEYGDRPGFCVQQAYNSAREGPVPAAAAKAIANASFSAPVLLRAPSSRKPYRRDPALQASFSAHSDVSALTFTPDGRRVISGGRDGRIRVWDPKTGECCRTVELTSAYYHVEGLAVSADGSLAVTAPDMTDRVLRTWNLRAGIETSVSPLTGHEKGFGTLSVAMTPDGRLAVSGSPDKTVRVWDLATGACLKSLEAGEPVLGLQIRPDGRSITALTDKQIMILEPESGTITSRTKLDNSYTRMAATLDGGRVVLARENVLAIADGQSVGEIARLPETGETITSLALTPSGEVAVCGSTARNVYVYDVAGRRLLRTYRGHSEGVSAVGIRADGKFAVSGSTDGTVCVWDLTRASSEAIRPELKGKVRALSIVRDMKAALCQREDGKVRLYLLESGEDITWMDLPGMAMGVGRFCFSRNGTIVHGWDMWTGRKYVLQAGERPGKADAKFPVLTLGMLQKADGASRGASYGADRIWIWDFKTGACTGGFQVPGHCPAMAISMDGKLVAASGSDHAVRIWDVERSRIIHTLEGHKEEVSALAFTPDCRALLSGSAEGMLRLWRTAAGTEVRMFGAKLSFLSPNQSLGSIRWVAVTPDGRKAVVAESAHTMFTCDLASGAVSRPMICAAKNAEPMPVVSEDGRWAINGVGQRNVRVWDLESTACAALTVEDAALTRISAAAGKVAFVDVEGDAVFLAFRNLPLAPAIYTAPVDVPAPCFGCGKDLELPPAARSAIEQYERRAGECPCFELPPEAWQDPRLESRCAACGAPIRFNPFFASSSPQGVIGSALRRMAGILRR